MARLPSLPSRRVSIRRWLAVLLVMPALAPAAFSQMAWRAEGTLLLPGPAGAFDETAVKDPSIVNHDGRWHLFYTARGRGEYTIGYVQALNLEDLAAAPRHQLAQLRGADTLYAAAPQVFYFRPHRLWYMIFQNRDANYQPVFSTTETLSEPSSWSAPRPLVEKNDEAKWIDFWVICDNERAFLFYTRQQREVYQMTTPVSQFPEGFAGARRVFGPVHEAAHIYRVKGDRPRFWMLFEDNHGDRRSYGLAVASRLDGPWELFRREIATGGNLRFPPGAEAWTAEVSHGELLRSGFDETLEVEPANLRFLVQGMPLGLHKGSYPSLPWRLGILRAAGFQ